MSVAMPHKKRIKNPSNSEAI